MRILREETSGIIIDIQEKLIPVIYNSEDVKKKAIQLIKGLEILEIPIVFSQQYTKGLGNTIDLIKDKVTNFQYFEKLTFSCVDENEIIKNIKEINKRNVLVAGIESHVCVLQTVIDLKAKGFSPIVVVDAIGSRKELDKEIALKRMELEGIVLTTVESILFELCRSAGDSKFREISKLVK